MSRKRGRSGVKVKIESKRPHKKPMHRRKYVTVSAAVGRTGVKLKGAGAMQLVKRYGRGRKIAVNSKLTALARQCNAIKKRVNLGQGRAQYYRAPTAIPTSIGHELGYIDFDNGMMDWSTISATPTGRTAGLPYRYSFNNQLMYITPQTDVGSSNEHRTGDSINWRHTTIRVKMQLPEKAGGSSTHFTPFIVRFVVFKFTGIKGMPILFENHASTVKNYPRQKDLWEVLYELDSQSIAWAENSFRKDCATLRKRISDGPSPCSFVFDQSYVLPYAQYNRKVHDIRIKLNHGNGVKVGYDTVQNNQLPTYDPESPLGNHYFLAAYVQQPLRIKNDTAGNTIDKRAPNYILNGSNEELKVEAHISVTHRFDA